VTAPAAARCYGVGRVARFRDERVKPMTVRDAIIQAVPVFVAHPSGGPDALRAELVNAGLPAALAAEVVEFLPLAVARAMLHGMRIRFADHYVRQTAQGRVIGEKKLEEEPVYREGLAMADEIGRMGEETLMAVVNWSPEYRTISQMLSTGSQADELVCAPPTMLANNEDERFFDDTSGGSQQRPWWKFWG
jgi:hypothetical protein